MFIRSNFLITPANGTFILYDNYAVTIIKINNVPLARVNKKFTVISHPSFTGLFSTYLQLVAVR